jgi:hypothetical protein
MQYLPKNEQPFSAGKRSFEQNITRIAAHSARKITATLQQTQGGSRSREHSNVSHSRFSIRSRVDLEINKQSLSMVLITGSVSAFRLGLDLDCMILSCKNIGYIFSIGHSRYRGGGIQSHGLVWSERLHLSRCRIWEERELATDIPMRTANISSHLIHPFG